MNAPRQLSPEQVKYERAKDARARHILQEISKDKAFIDGTLEGMEQDERNEGVALEDARRRYVL